MESAVTAPVSGHIKRVLVHEGVVFCVFLGSCFNMFQGDSLNQGDLVVEIVH